MIALWGGHTQELQFRFQRGGRCTAQQFSNRYYSQSPPQLVSYLVSWLVGWLVVQLLVSALWQLPGRGCGGRVCVPVSQDGRGTMWLASGPAEQQGAD